ncbi:hypothetical protein P245_19805 [Comamonas thiooxydans]|uniref:Uncharacterized protein n=1 Tax=Comamonas thiooxydans TaxID=363952 RepID=A0A0E3BGN6_9BURK|nr:hypothetical protein [Comamonas thiooxydans]KGG87699.1 hypothetical protein P245_19805 [Comamonas thiooxydans]
MNAERRKKLEAIKERLTTLMGEASSLGDELAELRDEEQNYFDNMPEGLQGGVKGEKAQAAIDAMENVVGLLEDFAGIDSDELDTAAE